LLREPAQAARQVFAQAPQTAIQRNTRANQAAISSFSAMS